MEFANQSLTFQSDALAEDTLLVKRFVGEERLSSLFRFELELVSTRSDIEGKDVLYKPAKVGLKQSIALAGGGAGTRTRWFMGVLSEFELLEQAQGATHYRAVLVPQLWLLGLYHRSRVFLDKTIDELVTEVLKGELSLAPGDDFEFKLTRTGQGDPKERDVYPMHEYTVQYEETDLNFVSRWLEREGIFYFFENDDVQEKAVFADSEGAYAPADPNAGAYPYRPAARTQGRGEEGEAHRDEVRTFACGYARVPQQVVLEDYNWRTPTVSLEVTADVLADAQGLYGEYNHHYKTPEQGKALAQMRAGELSCRQELYHGTSTCRAFRPGKTFKLAEHFRDAFNQQDYVLVSVRHEAEQSLNIEASAVTGASYVNSFEAIPAAVVYRPPRRAPWPSIKGVIHGQIDGESDTGYAELDEYGRYKVILPFDHKKKDAQPGKASRWIRMMQPYAGVDSGFHFPLLKGTEVVLIHVDGDPDRPIIAGALPNPDRCSPVDQGSSHQNRIVTTSGNLFAMDDDSGKAGFILMSAGGGYVVDTRQATSGGGGGAPGGGGGGGVEPPLTRAKRVVDRRRAAAGGTPAPAAESAGAPPPAPPRPSPAPRPRAERAGELPGPGRGGNEGPVCEPQIDPFDRFYGGSNLANVGGQGAVDAGVDKVSELGAGLTCAPEPHNIFKGEAFDQRLEIRIGGNHVKIHKGDRYTYEDISVEKSFGTGGESEHTEEGDVTSKTTHNGNVTAESTHNGNVDSTSTHMGDVTSSSTHMGSVDQKSYYFGQKTSFELEGSDEDATAIKLGAKDALSVHVGAFREINLLAGGKFTLNLSAAAMVEISLAKWDKVQLPQEDKLQIKSMTIAIEETEVRMVEKSAYLKADAVSLKKTSASLKQDEAVLAATSAKLKEDNAALKQTNAALKQDQAVLKHTTAALKHDTTSLQQVQMALSEESRCVSIKKTGVIVQLGAP